MNPCGSTSGVRSSVSTQLRFQRPPTFESDAFIFFVNVVDFRLSLSRILLKLLKTGFNLDAQVFAKFFAVSRHPDYFRQL